MSLLELINNIKKSFDEDHVERINKINCHLQNRLKTLLNQPKRILRPSLDKAANDQWKERLSEEDSYSGNEFYTAK